MNDNSMAIAVFCSHLCVGEGVSPLTPKEWSDLAKELMQQGIQPAELLRFSRQDFYQKLQASEAYTDQLLRLIDRSASLSFELSKYENMGIILVTRADAVYPSQLKKKLKNSCPPIFYAAGNTDLLHGKSIGYVGSRTVSDEDISFAKATVHKTVGLGYSVVSGGAKGSDSVAEEEALSMGGTAIAYLSDSMLRKLKNAKIVQAVQQGTLLLLSVAKPDAGFNTGIAMMRNKYIYAQSSATVIIKADYNKGGTWTGALENLKNGWAPALCWRHDAYPGNKTLIERGAVPIDETWSGDMEPLLREHAQEQYEQISMF
jgi:predicted Rossmann fold nucleotide-binding protein DprA/Smf involved in DNA uptake